MKQDHNGHGIRHYACSDAWEPEHDDIHTTCTVLDEGVKLKNPSIPSGDIKADEIMPLQFMQ